MKKALVLLGLVLGIGWGGTALAQSGSDSSGRHSYDLECVGEDLIVTNTGVGTDQDSRPVGDGPTGVHPECWGVEELRPPGVDTGPVGTSFEVCFEDPAGSNNFHGLDGGTFPTVSTSRPGVRRTRPLAEIVCAGPGVEVTNTGTGDLIAYGATIGTRTELPAGASHTFAWGTGGPNNDLLDPTGWDAVPRRRRR